jgi:hypothetical protein
MQNSILSGPEIKTYVKIKEVTVPVPPYHTCTYGDGYVLPAQELSHF